MLITPRSQDHTDQVKDQRQVAINRKSNQEERTISIGVVHTEYMTFHLLHILP